MVLACPSSLGRLSFPRLLKPLYDKWLLSLCGVQDCQSLLSGFCCWIWPSWVDLSPDWNIPADAPATEISMDPEVRYNQSGMIWLAANTCELGTSCQSVSSGSGHPGTRTHSTALAARIDKPCTCCRHWPSPPHPPGHCSGRHLWSSPCSGRHWWWSSSPRSGRHCHWWSSGSAPFLWIWHSTFQLQKGYMSSDHYPW